jgi:hypothetical protein
MRLTKDASECSDRYLAMLRDDGGVGDFAVLRTNLTWLPFWLYSENPAASSRRLTSRKGRGLSRSNFYLNDLNFRHASRLWFLEMELQSFSQVGQGLFLGLSLAGDVEF